MSDYGVARRKSLSSPGEWNTQLCSAHIGTELSVVKLICSAHIGEEPPYSLPPEDLLMWIELTICC
jgi:hypothetical protein